MSWLDSKIKRVLNKRTVNSIDLAIATMMAEITAEYQKKLAHNNLRVNDVNGEGILNGSRSNTTRNPHTGTLELTCDSRTVVRGREEAYSRAFFNQKNFQIGTSDVMIISYEAPLLRQNQDRGGNICKIDLVGLSQGALLPIEYKHSHGPATTSRYGILEGIAYGMLLAKHMCDNAEGINQQIIHCLQDRGPYSGVPIAFNATTASVKYFVAAPRAFFIEDTRTKVRRDKTNLVTQAVRKYASGFSQKTGKMLEFGGFLVIGSENPSVNARRVRNGIVSPTFCPPITQVKAYNTIDEVFAVLNQQI